MWKGEVKFEVASRNISQKGARANRAWAALRLRDRIEPGVKVLFVGINPGVRSAVTGHHFAGYSNRFWKLLWQARLVPKPISYLDDERLPEWGFGITNLIPRPSPGIDDLGPDEYFAGWRSLDRKLRRYRPAVVALVGVTLYRAILPLLETGTPRRRGSKAPSRGPRPPVPGPRLPAVSVVGRQKLSVHGARVFVLPNPSGRNANFTYTEMLAAFRALRREIARL
jgi:double-stranded uracil-DNA glycosylase